MLVFMYASVLSIPTDHALITGSPYRDAEGSPQHRSCLHDEIINAAPIIGEKIDQS